MDENTPIHVSVTQEMIDTGLRWKGCYCALGKAINAAAGISLPPMEDFDTEEPARYFVVGIDWVNFRDRDLGHLAEFSLPEAAVNLRRSFDAEKPVSPMEFELPPLSEWNRREL